MATQVQLRRGNTSQTNAFTGAVAEITVDTDKETVVVHDGSTAGGFPLARESALSANLAFTQAAFNLANTANIKIDSGYAFANTVNIKVDAAFSFSNSVNIKTDAAFVRANAANVLAQAAFDKANQTAQLAFTTVSANGTSLVADANNDTLTITAAVANGIQILANATSDTLDIGLKPSGVTAGTYGNTSTAVTITIDQFGRITSVSQTAITAVETDPLALAYAIALG